MPIVSSRTVSTARALAVAIVLLLMGSLSPRAQVSSGWSTSGAEILTPLGAPFVITGINWYGFETTDAAAHGLWTKDYRYILNEARQYGYSTVRIPFSNQMWETNPVP